MLVVPGTREVSPRLLPHGRATPGTSMVKFHQETFVPATASHIFLYTTNRAWLLIRLPGNQNNVCKIMSFDQKRYARGKSWVSMSSCFDNNQHWIHLWWSFSTDNPWSLYTINALSGLVLAEKHEFQGEWRQSLVGGGRIVLHQPMTHPWLQVQVGSSNSSHTLPSASGHWVIFHSPKFLFITLSVSHTTLFCHSLDYPSITQSDSI